MQVIFFLTSKVASTALLSPNITSNPRSKVPALILGLKKKKKKDWWHLKLSQING